MKEAREFETAFKSFLYDVSEATSMLIYALAGIEVYRKAFPTQPEVSIPPAYVTPLVRRHNMRPLELIERMKELVRGFEGKRLT